jgi:hypothetical protein
VHAGRGQEALQRPHHEKPAVHLETGIEEEGGMGARGVQQQLRFHAVNLRGVQEQLKKVAKQRLLDLASRDSVA